MIPFDGLVPVFSTCRDCGEIMVVTNHWDTVHPTCEPRPTRMERWQQSWLEIARSAPYEKLRPELQKKLDDLEFRMESEADYGLETALANAANQYAEWGWRVFPLAYQRKQPAIRSAHPQGDPLRGVCKGECGKSGHGVLDATADEQRVCRWWSLHPEHNVGLATGYEFDVIDVDPDKGGAESLAKLLAAKRIPEVHGVVATAGSDKPRRPAGLHLYVKATGRGNYAGVMPGVDYRGRGGYVVAPPSTLGSRIRSWSWVVEPSPIIKGGNKNGASGSLGRGHGNGEPDLDCKRAS